MSKKTIHQNFTLSLVDFILVIFFFLTCSILGFYFNSFFILNLSKLKANWIEQICNAISQCAFFIAILIMILN